MSYSSLLPVVSVATLTLLETIVGLPFLPDAMDLSKRNAGTVGASLESVFATTREQRQTVQQQERVSFSDSLAQELELLRRSGGSANAPTDSVDAQTVQAEASAKSTEGVQAAQEPVVAPASETAVVTPPVAPESLMSLFNSRSLGGGAISGEAGSASVLPTRFASLSPDDLSLGESFFDPTSPGSRPLTTQPSPVRPTIPGSITDVPAVSLPMPILLMLGALACLVFLRFQRALSSVSLARTG
ncbi:MAG: hypothetical protein NXH97_13410 [Rhodobacteraceae bacterium]|nr:hypothetical protein [Paracoccaceae bacterium]